jgi:glycosyltransferase involved in cell wall biosynthesis
MRIAVIAPPLLKVPPTNYGGLEIVVFDLCEALAEMGDDVTLIAPVGSHAKGCKLIETVIAPERTDVDWVGLEMSAFNIYKDKLQEFDIIHDHTWFGGVYLSKFDSANKNLKICKTHHGHLDWRADRIPPQIGKVNLIAISDFMRKEYEAQGWISKYVYNGIDLNKYPYSDKKEDRLVFVGRISTFKQPHLAIEAAVSSKTPIDIIGGSFVDKPEFLETIKTMCDNSNGLATLHLDLPHDEKVKFVQGAKACLVPSHMGEPFGLTIIEAFACGTPVIALNDGAIREVVGDTAGAGYVCDTSDEFVKIVRNIGMNGYAIKPRDCRNRAEYFSRENMAKRYKALYEKIIKGEEW